MIYALVALLLGAIAWLVRREFATRAHVADLERRIASLKRQLARETRM